MSGSCLPERTDAADDSAELKPPAGGWRPFDERPFDERPFDERASDEWQLPAKYRRPESDDRPPLRWSGLRHLFGAIFAFAAVLVLQLLLAAFYWIAEPSPAAALAPIWDAAALVLLLVAWAAVRRRRRRPAPADRLVVFAATVLVFLYVVIGLGQGFALREFGYDVVLRLHVAYVPELFRMMRDAEPLGWFVFYCALLAAGVIAVVAVIYAAIRHLHRYARSGRVQQVGLTLGVLAAFGLGAAAYGVNGPLTREAYTQLDLALHLDKRLDVTGRLMEMEAGRLRRANPFVAAGAERPAIRMFVVESYGQLMFTSERFAAFPPWLEEKGRALARAGYHVASKPVVAPVFGGGSWMAAMSLFCGVRVDNQKRFKALSGSAVPCLPDLLKRAGYRTVLSAGNIKYHDKEYEGTLRFDRFYIRDDFGYRGPRMGWAFMPDQLTIDFIHRREVAAQPAGSPAPLFVAYILTNSHHPWSVVPPLIRDWSKIGDGSIYAEVPATVFEDNGFVGGHDYRPAYIATVQYSFESVMSYLEQLPQGDRSAIFILGDHQPRRPLGDMKADTWEAPFHVLSRDPGVIERFSRVGYRPGWRPGPSEGPPSGFEKFISELFAAYGGERVQSGDSTSGK